MDFKSMKSENLRERAAPLKTLAVAGFFAKIFQV
jgi:hypothetical protein